MLDRDQVERAFARLPVLAVGGRLGFWLFTLSWFHLARSLKQLFHASESVLRTSCAISAQSGDAIAHPAQLALPSAERGHTDCFGTDHRMMLT